MAPEAKVKALIKRRLQSFGPAVYWFMPVQTGYGRAGIPDFIGCADGQFFSIEAKAGKNKPTQHQRREMGKIDAAGGRAFVVWGEEDMKEVSEWIKEQLPYPY